MLENMSGFVGDALREDRLRQSVTNARSAEAGKGHTQRQARMPRQSRRAVVARALVALAARIAPTVALPDPGTHALAP